MKLIKPIATLSVGPRRKAVEGVLADEEFVWSTTLDDRLLRFHRGDLAPKGSFPFAGYLAATTDSGILTRWAGECRAVRRSDCSLVWSASSRFWWYLWKDAVVLPGETQVELRRVDSGEVMASLPLSRRATSAGAFASGEGILVLQAESKEMFAVELASGEELWCRDMFGRLHAEWSLAQQTYPYLSSADGSDGPVSFYRTATIAWSARDGSIKWVRNVRGEGSAPPTVSGGRVFGMLNEFWALDEATGDVLWRTPLPAELKVCVRPRPGLVYRNRIVFAFESGRLAVLDVTTGEIVRYFKSAVPLWWPAEVDGRLLVGTGDGTILVFDESIWGI